MQDHDARWRDRVDKSLDELEDRLDALEGSQKFFKGAAVIVIWALGFFADKLRHLLG